MLERLPERVKTPAVARAITSPSGILAAGAGLSVAIVAGLPVVAAVAVGALAWGARVALAVPRQAKGERIDPFAVGEPWRHSVMEAVRARARFEQTVDAARPGPLKDRLVDVGRRIDQGAEECWRIARQGDALRSAVGRLGVDQARRELEQVRAELARAPEADRPPLQKTAAALEAQVASAERIEKVSNDAATRLRVLNAQLDEAVARAVELSLSTSETDLSPLSDDVDSLVGELESLRLALEETAAAGGGVT
ncbi:MAG TPA: hypothetical protein VFJ85_06835 [Acidimicrobiales bacterium]|nr:hypothetical protein [Acidimicrobiales bacterium]